MLDELQHLLLIVEHGTFTAAARHAHLTQPALSASIVRLEEQLGARLLHRGRGGATLTAAGEALLPSARAALSAIEAGRRAVAEVEGLQSGEVRIGAGATAATYLLPPVFAEYRRRYPGVRIVMRELPREQLREQLDSGKLDICVVTAEGGETWRWDEFVLVAAPDHEVAWDDAGAPAFITFARGTTTRQVLEQHFPKAEIVMELGSISAAKGHVRAGIGVALIARAAVERDLERGQLVVVDHPKTPIPRELSLLHRGVERLPPAALALRELLLEQGAEGAVNTLRV